MSPKVLFVSQESETELSTTRNRLPRGTRYIVRNKIIFWLASYSACVVYTRTIIHLSVGESDEYLPRRFAAR